MINIINELGVTENVSVVRFFKANNANYLMYTLSEKDEAGYIKLYASKMLDAATFSKIEDEEEWSLVKELIKVIVKEAKENNLVSVEDLDFTKLNGIKVLGTRVFKLTEQVAEMLGGNKKSFVVETPKPEVEPLFVETDNLKDEVEAQSFEELLSQSAPKVAEVDAQTPVLEKLSFEEPVAETPVKEVLKMEDQSIAETPKLAVEQLVGNETTVETNNVLNSETTPIMEPTKKLSTLEELLGQYSEETVQKNEQKVSENVIESTLAKEENLNNHDLTMKALEDKVAELESKIAKIVEILK